VTTQLGVSEWLIKSSMGTRHRQSSCLTERVLTRYRASTTANTARSHTNQQHTAHTMQWVCYKHGLLVLATHTLHVVHPTTASDKAARLRLSPFRRRRCTHVSQQAAGLAAAVVHTQAMPGTAAAQPGCCPPWHPAHHEAHADSHSHEACQNLGKSDCWDKVCTTHKQLVYVLLLKPSVLLAA
jgi:hypothetical protein